MKVNLVFTSWSSIFFQTIKSLYHLVVGRWYFKNAKDKANRVAKALLFWKGPTVPDVIIGTDSHFHKQQI